MVQHWAVVLLALGLGGCQLPQAIGCEDVVCTHGTCVVREGAAACVCSASELAAGLECTVDTGPEPSVIGPVLPLNVGGAVHGQLEDKEARDRYEVTLVPGHGYTFRCVPEGDWLCQVVVSLQRVTLADSGAQGTPGLASLSAAASGPFVVAVNAVGGAGSYSLVAEPLLEMEGNTAASATLLMLDQSFRGTLNYAGDDDYFRIPLVGRGWYTLSYDRDDVWTELDVVDSEGRPVSSGSGRIKSDSESLLIRVSGVRGTYQVSVALLALDDHADSFEGAARVAVRTPFELVIEERSDVDAFVFQPIPGYVYSFVNVGAEACNLPAAFEAASANEVLFRVGGHRDGQRCSVVINEELDDYGDTQATATEVVPGSLSFLRQYPDDVDFFFIHLLRGETLITSNLMLAPPEVGTSDLDVSLSSYRFLRATTDQNVFLSGGAPWNPTCYDCLATIAVSDADLAGDTLESAAPATIPMALTGALETGFDDDVYAFEVPAAGTFRLLCNAYDSDWRGRCTLYDGTETPFASHWQDLEPGGLTVTLAAGPHYLRVSGSRSGSTSPVIMAAPRRYQVTLKP